MYNPFGGPERVLFIMGGVAIATAVIEGGIRAAKKPELEVYAYQVKLAGLCVNGAILLDTMGRLATDTFKVVGMFF